ncbi:MULTISPECIES: hypothetical protein, partial [unclassified Roseovarius]|uniref:hypothetical protein n=1 Tax=unclassified Roseovarius TaxID=2614913 RepID=UPI00273E6EC4
MINQRAQFRCHVPALREVEEEAGKRRQEILKQGDEFACFHKRGECLLSLASGKNVGIKPREAVLCQAFHPGLRL